MLFFLFVLFNVVSMTFEIRIWDESVIKQSTMSAVFADRRRENCFGF